MLAETQTYCQFFVAQFRVIRWEVCGKFAFVVAGSTMYGTFEQPFTDTIFRASTHPAKLAQQGRNMNSIAEPPGQRRVAQSLNRLHPKTLT